MKEKYQSIFLKLLSKVHKYYKLIVTVILYKITRTKAMWNQDLVMCLWTFPTTAKNHSFGGSPQLSYWPSLILYLVLEPISYTQNLNSDSDPAFSISSWTTLKTSPTGLPCTLTYKQCPEGTTKTYNTDIDVISFIPHFSDQMLDINLE